ncbi:MAG: acetyl-CoA carboxylase biotin carboxylase subunit [Planctomyces sp.]|nr:acetyl-CoA carboxylase biotin carboxylase subunit [Planctomyces sp.]MBA4120516.1 acetyl-CoA carboxylase biotin carboxylase subunit [Isosphaera sp.]
MFTRILIANRGEIALRVIRACRELGVEPVCVYSEADRDAPYLRLADQAICIGPGPAKESYLNIGRIIAAAEVANVDAIHPGYGFLSERAEFAQACRDCKIEFIGPTPEAMARLGDKVSCKLAAKEAGVPIFPGSPGALEDEEEAARLAASIGYPVIIKASAGGGGRGMRVCHNEAALRSNLRAASAEALAAFGNGAVFIEKFLEHAQHVEIQVIGDKHGGAVHLWERNCSVQRRHQKLIEEAPSPGLDRAKIEPVCQSAVRLITQAKYHGAATVEFLMDQAKNFYMLEVNTRVQVEHPVTEMVTGIDIVKTMIRVAAGERLPFSQRDVQLRGHAIECRINAEDPARGFMPQPGPVQTWHPPGGPGVRMDTHVVAGYVVPKFYDSMVAKLIVHADDRRQCITRTARALREFRVEPIKTTIPLHQRLMEEAAFVEGGVDIHYLERLLK